MWSLSFVSTFLKFNILCYIVFGDKLLPRNAMLARYINCSRVSVCLSACHMPALYQKAKRRITQTTPYDSPGILVFWCQRSGRNFNGVTLNGSAKWRCGRLHSAIFYQYLAISHKRCKIGTYLLRNSNMNSM